MTRLQRPQRAEQNESEKTVTMPDRRNSRNTTGSSGWSEWARRQRACGESLRDLVLRGRRLPWEAFAPGMQRRPTAQQSDREETGQARQRGDQEPSPQWAANSVFPTLCLPCYDPAKHDWDDAPEGAPDGTRYPTPTGRDETAGVCRRNPDGTLQPSRASPCSEKRRAGAVGRLQDASQRFQCG